MSMLTFFIFLLIVVFVYILAHLWWALLSSIYLRINFRSGFAIFSEFSFFPEPLQPALSVQDTLPATLQADLSVQDTLPATLQAISPSRTPFRRPSRPIFPSNAHMLIKFAFEILECAFVFRPSFVHVSFVHPRNS